MISISSYLLELPLFVLMKKDVSSYIFEFKFTGKKKIRLNLSEKILTGVNLGSFNVCHGLLSLP